jgi:hypothetical protein
VLVLRHQVQLCRELPHAKQSVITLFVAIILY